MRKDVYFYVCVWKNKQVENNKSVQPSHTNTHTHDTKKNIRNVYVRIIMYKSMRMIEFAIVIRYG